MSRILAYLAHAYTGLGVSIAFLTAWNILAGDYRKALLWMLAALVIDSTDGFVARWFRVKVALPEIDGRKLDDIIDYLNYTFLPLLMIGMAGWLPEPWVLWVSLAAFSSLLGFCNTGAKAEAEGFFLGFPSYWNVVALYFLLLHEGSSSILRLVILLALSVATLLPIRFIYPSHFKRWRIALMGGVALWMILLFGILWLYPDVSYSVVVLSFCYPVLYLLVSFVEG